MAAFMACSSSGDDENAAEKMTEFFGPEHIDQFIRQAVQFCWTALPKDRKNPDELEKQLKRLLDRAIRDFKEDREQFGRA